VRHSFGSRVWGTRLNWKYDAEGVYQFGSFARKEISAWTLSFNGSYQFKKVRYLPEIGLKTEMISGDATLDDERLQTFNPLFPRGAYFGLGALIGPANIWDVHPSLALSLIPEKLVGAIDYDIFWRYSRQDGIYSPAVNPIYWSNGISHRFIGHQATIDFTYTPHNHILIRAEGTWFKSGAYLKAAGAGKDILFSGLTAQFKF
jgi:hypothetical protein